MKRGRKQIYPWGKLLDGNVYLLEWGNGFWVSPKIFRCQCINRARAMGLKAATLVHGDMVFVCAELTGDEA